ncbi:MULTISPECIES: monovalent cation/H(+) antiporter subunit G [unclassified Wenzhouxiangella]|uniref:monovalent cation/H(+) antiporter subunit G n=1 Tax=unclassified Wenzhouxiangella TaxID=2613841 RepID=UPI000E329C93|nr:MULTISPECIES: monovalent cation/H(+) antiporter subunit G [unclassified Wenzhouxiangella]RFF28090.1 monovalent cation/H(+) antiporter subunit G [Wenzhouxiangella sp. 15181]RFP68680.1 monovalent cation/H(+) antiporter subunit G [Wenzhouxiangella sp. 15190]
MAAIQATLAGLLIVAGAAFFFIGTIGLLRLPDFYTRVHAVTKCDALGAGLVLLGLAILAGFDGSGIRIIALIALVLLSSPTAGHALARAAWRAGLEPWYRKSGHVGQ